MIPARAPAEPIDEKRLAAILRAFYFSPVSLAAMQPVLELAVELNPDLRGLPIGDNDAEERAG